MNVKGDKNRSVRATKRKLQEALVELLHTKSIDSITVRELTEKADVNRSTFYLHYKDVYGLLEQMEKKGLADIKEFLTSAALNDFSAEGYPMLNWIFSYLYENQERFIVIFGPNGRKEAKQEAIDICVEHVLRVLVEDCGYQGSEEMEIGVRFMFEGGFGVLMHQSHSGKPFHPDNMIRFYTQLTMMMFQGYQQEIQR